jgi:hypothetical protein
VTFRRRTTFPGLDPRAASEIVALQDELLTELRALRGEAVGITTDTKTTTYACRFNERVICLPPTAGLDLTFPGATPQTQNRWIEVIKLGGGDVRIRATSGNVQGASTALALTTAGFYYFQSDARTGWWMQPSGGGGGGETLAATLLLGNTTGGTDINMTGGSELQVGGSPGALGNVLTSQGPGASPIWAAAAAGSVSMTDATITLPYSGLHSGTATVVDAAILVGSRVGIFWGSVLGSDVNEPEGDDVSFTCIPAAGSMTVRVSSDKAPVGGPYKIRYLIG